MQHFPFCPARRVANKHSPRLTSPGVAHPHTHTHTDRFPFPFNTTSSPPPVAMNAPCVFVFVFFGWPHRRRCSRRSLPRCGMCNPTCSVRSRRRGGGGQPDAAGCWLLAALPPLSLSGHARWLLFFTPSSPTSPDGLFLPLRINLVSNGSWLIGACPIAASTLQHCHATTLPRYRIITVPHYHRPYQLGGSLLALIDFFFFDFFFTCFYLLTLLFYSLCGNLSRRPRELSLPHNLVQTVGVS